MPFRYVMLAARESPNNRDQIMWTPFPAVPGAPPSLDLVSLLNALGQQGWEAMMAIDVGGGTRSEIILKKLV